MGTHACMSPCSAALLFTPQRTVIRQRLLKDAGQTNMPILRYASYGHGTQLEQHQSFLSSTYLSNFLSRSSSASAACFAFSAALSSSLDSSWSFFSAAVFSSPLRPLALSRRASAFSLTVLPHELSFSAAAFRAAVKSLIAFSLSAVTITVDLPDPSSLTVDTPNQPCLKPTAPTATSSRITANSNFFIGRSFS